MLTTHIHQIFIVHLTLTSFSSRTWAGYVDRVFQSNYFAQIDVDSDDDDDDEVDEMTL